MLTDPTNRTQWPRLLMAVPASDVHQLVASLPATLVVEDLQLPQSGLALLQLEDSALGDAYFLGEVPLSRARVRVTALDGASAEGAAQILDDRQPLARSIAILDAVLAGRLEGFQAAQALLAQGCDAVDRQNAQRRALLAATRVNFSLIGEEDEDGDA